MALGQSLARDGETAWRGVWTRYGWQRRVRLLLTGGSGLRGERRSLGRPPILLPLLSSFSSEQAVLTGEDFPPRRLGLGDMRMTLRRHRRAPHCSWSKGCVTPGCHVPSSMRSRPSKRCSRSFVITTPLSTSHSTETGRFSSSR
jgi:hypothetical protein